MIATYEKICSYCGKLFIAHKSHAKFCSSTCRVKSHRHGNISRVTQINTNTKDCNVNNVNKINANTIYCNGNNVTQINTNYQHKEWDTIHEPNLLLKDMLSIEKYKHTKYLHFVSVMAEGRKYKYIGNVNDEQLENFMSLLGKEDKIAWDRDENNFYKLYVTQEVIDKLHLKTFK